MALSLKYGTGVPRTALTTEYLLLVSRVAQSALLRSVTDQNFCNLLNNLQENSGRSGRHQACDMLSMAVTRVEDFAAYEFAVRFKLEVYRLIKESRGASKNQAYREQLEDAASGIEGAMSEGFGRRRPKEFALYLRYSLGSLNESKTRLRDGIHRGYFQESACQQAFTWAERCKRATTELWRSQERKAAEEERELKSKKDKRKVAESQARKEKRETPKKA